MKYRKLDGSQTNRRNTKRPAGHYRLLGTTCKASGDTLKQKYIEKVKQFPPETHPEEFRKIRQAYDTLRDPKKRQAYDLERLHGKKPERLMKQALRYLHEDEFDQAKPLLQKVLAMDPRHMHALNMLGDVYLQEAAYREFERLFSETYQRAPEDFKPGILMAKAFLALGNEEAAMVLETMKSLKALHPNAAGEHEKLYGRISLESDMHESLWELACEQMDQWPHETWEAAHWPEYFHWLQVFILTKKWSYKSKVMARVKIYFKNVIFSRDLESGVTGDLWRFFHYSRSFGDYKAASVLLDLVKIIRPRDPDYLKQAARLHYEKQLNEEFSKFNRDPHISLPARLEVLKAYFSDVFPERLADLLNNIPPDIEELDQNHEDFTDNLAYIKRKYRIIYGAYKGKLDAIYIEEINKLDREARRSIQN